MFTGLASNLGDYPTVRIRIKNVTASALTQYGTYALDLAQADSDTTTVDMACHHVIAVSTGAIASGVLVVAQSAIPAGGYGEAVLTGRTKQRIDGTTDIAKQDGLKAQNASAVCVKATLGTNRFHSIALEAATDNSEANIEVLFNGLGSF